MEENKYVLVANNFLKGKKFSRDRIVDLLLVEVPLCSNYQNTLNEKSKVIELQEQSDK